MAEWQRADRSGERLFPHEFLYRLIRSGVLEEHYQIDPKDSCLAAAAERDLPIVVPGWEDSTSGNIFAAHCLKGDVKNVHTVKTGIEYMMVLSDWYTANCDGTGIGFFQIGGGIAGDFPTCVVPMLEQDMEQPRRCGATSARFQTPRRAMARIPVPSRTKRSRGANSARRRRGFSLKATPRLWLR